MKCVSTINPTGFANAGKKICCPVCGLPAMSVLNINGSVETRHRCRKCKQWFIVKIAE